MAPPGDSHYETLGVSRDARHGEIVRAYERLTAEFRKDTTPPDARREARIREAFEVLADAARREAYDATLVQAVAAPDRRTAIAAGIGAAVLLAAAGAYFAFGTRGTAAKPARTPAEIQADVSRSIGRVRSIDLSGAATATGIAFTVGPGVMATTCEGLAPGAQIVVTLGTRGVPARIAGTDEARGLCRLAVEGAGSWPLPLGGVEPRVGDTVYAAGVNEAGDVVLAEGTVKGVAAQGRARIVEASVPAGAGIGGRPLLDTQGKVVAVATAAQPGGPARHVFVPAHWAEEDSPPSPAY